MHRIIFVDDDENILRGLKRGLRKQLDQWEMEFVDSGQKAIELFDQKPFDVIVSDMRMPEMNGAELLSKIAQKYPATIRMILSGYSEEEYILRSIVSTHQFICKPCESEDIINVVSRAITLRSFLKSRELMALTASLNSLPSLPEHYTKITKLLADENVSLIQLANIISQDVGMVAKILQVANSAFFGAKRNITEVRTAIELLGIATIRHLVLALEVFSQFDSVRCRQFGVKEIFDHSFKVSQCSSRLVVNMDVNKSMVNEVVAAGMLHDVGKLVLMSRAPKEYKQVMQIMESRDVRIDEAEKEVFGATHAEVGAYLLALWGLKDEIVEAVAYHHYPLSCSHQQLSLLSYVYMGDNLARCICDYDQPCYERLALNEDYLKNIGVSKTTEEWRALCNKNSY